MRTEGVTSIELSNLSLAVGRYENLRGYVNGATETMLVTLSLKYQKFKPSGFKEIAIGKFEFVAKTH